MKIYHQPPATNSNTVVRITHDTKCSVMIKSLAYKKSSRLRLADAKPWFSVGRGLSDEAKLLEVVELHPNCVETIHLFIQRISDKIQGVQIEILQKSELHGGGALRSTIPFANFTQTIANTKL